MMVVIHHGVYVNINLKIYHYNQDGNNIYIKLKQANLKMINIEVWDMD